MSPVCLILLSGLVTTAAAKVRLAFDCGGCGPLQDGWIPVASCRTYSNVGNTDIDVTIAVGDGGACSCRSYFDEGSDGPATGPLAAVEQDFIFADDRRGSPGADVIITFSDLVAGARYRLFSYHNRLDESQTTIQGVVVTGATNVTKPDTIDQEHNRIINPAVVTFTAGAGDVTIRYLGPKRKRKRDQVFLNGFVLEGGPADVSFATAESAGVEEEVTVKIKVNLTDPQSEAVTVQYAVTGGTAKGLGLDYSLTPGTLTFNPEEIQKTIDIPIVRDGMNEDDETIELTLSNVAGGNATLGKPAKHTYTIVDPRVPIGFAPAGSTRLESESPVEVNVKLAEASKKTVAVDYSVVGGSAASGTDYEQLACDTLIFKPGETTKTIEIELVKDSIKEGPEHIVLELCNPVNAKLTTARCTCTIVDSWADYTFEMFKLDLACPGKPDTLKPGWTAWEIAGGCEDLPQKGACITNIAGTGIDAHLGIEGDKPIGNLRMLQGQPICNSFFSHYNNYAMEAAVELTLCGEGLVPGEYWLYTYHSARSNKVMPRITAGGPGVTQIGKATGVPIQVATSDEELVPSLVKFYTDGSGPVKITYQAPEKFNAAVNAFVLHNTVTPPYATNPAPEHKAKDVPPDRTLSWVAGSDAASHNVYLGTDLESVKKATTSSPEYRANVKQNSFKPGLLKFGQTYYWRVDEVSKAAGPIKSKLWQFTIDRGQARNPIPANGGNALEGIVLQWSGGAYGERHELYFGTNRAAVASADKSSTEYKGSFPRTAYNPGTLKTGTVYFWRVDETGKEASVKGDLWRFRVTKPVHLRVDFALTKWQSKELVPGSAKPGWWHWTAERWSDMYMHDGLWEDGGNTKPAGPGIDGSGVHAFVTTGSEGQLGLHVKGMCRDNLAGDGPPTGTPKGEPIANSWLYAVDWAGEYTGDIMLVLSDLPASQYQLISHHNHWEPCSQATRHCMDCVCDDPRMPPMPFVSANPLPTNAPHEYDKWGLPKGTGKGVTAIRNAYDVAPTNVLEDDKVSKSNIVFETDGSEVLVIYRAGSNAYPDCGRNRREGSRGILNAFELYYLGPISVHTARAQ